jgi:hypothetical protein
MLVAIMCRAAEKGDVKLTLSMNQRFYILRMLPPEGDLGTIITLEGIRKKLNPTDEEIEKHGIANIRGAYRMDPEEMDKVAPREIPFNEQERVEIKRAYKKLDREKKLLAHAEVIALCKMLEDF